MITIAYLELSGILSCLEDNILNLPQEDIDKAKSYIHKEDQARSLGASILIRRFISGDKICYTKDGKPFIENALKFSISHSGDYSAIAFAEIDVGIDIQKIVDVKDKLFEYSLTPKELKKAKTSEDFIRIWSLKESLVKCVGTGFNTKPNQIESCEVENTPYEFNNETYISVSRKIKNDYDIWLTYKSNIVKNIKLINLKLEDIIDK